MPVVFITFFKLLSTLLWVLLLARVILSWTNPRGGGAITATSAPGQGTTIRFTLPMTRT